MADGILYQIDDGIAVLSVPAGADGAPGALGLATRCALVDALGQAEHDDAVTGIVITGSGHGFPGPIPMEEIARGEATPTLAEVCGQIAQSTKPIVAAVRGEVYDGGFELALAAQARLAVAGTRLRLGNIRMGLIPGAGGTQRLPRLIGAGIALDLMLSGRVIGVESGALRGLFRKVVGKNVVGEAVQAARAMQGDPVSDAAPGFADPVGYQADLAERRAKAGQLPPEAVALFDLVEAAQLLPIEAGLAMEDVRRADLWGNVRAKGLVHTVALENRQARMATIALPERVTVLGDGPLAFGLVQRLLAAGFSVHLAERREGGAAQLIRQIGVAFQSEVDRGRLAQDLVRSRMRDLAGGESSGYLRQAEFVIEACEAGSAAVPALVDLVEGATGPQVPVVITSGMTLAAGDHAARLGGRILGLALHAAAQQPGLAELVAPDGEADAVAQAAALMHRMERQVVHCLPENGLIVGRLKAAMLGAAIWCVRQGATPDAVDLALGWPRGAFQVADAEGLPRQRARFETLGMDRVYGGFVEAFLAQGYEGRATGRGVLSYGEHGAVGDYDATASAIVDRWRGGAVNAVLTSEAIRRRVWSALLSAGVQLIERGVVHDAGDIDLAALVVLGLPRASGGPMKAAELRGLLLVKGELGRWQSEEPALWQQSELLSEMVKNGRGFGP